MERLTDKKEADKQRERYEKRLQQGYPRNIPEERFLKLAHYEDLSEQDRLIELPCKVGDTVYPIHEIKGRKVIASTETDLFMLCLCVAEKRFGSTVFLTRGEAEKKLKEMESE